MSGCVWYVSKYLTLPEDRVGGRSFLLLREMAEAGYRAVAFASDANHLVAGPRLDGASLRRTIDGVEVVWVRTRKYAGAKSIGRILSWLDFEWRLWRLPKRDFPRPEVVVVSSLSLLSIANGWLMRRRHRCPLVFEVRDIWPLTIVEEGGFGRFNPFVMALGLIERFAYRTSDLIVGTMPNLSEHVREVAGEVAAPVACIPMGVDPALLEPAEPLDPDWAKANLPQGKFVVCHAGTIGITNALEPLLECARRMQARDDIHFLVVGDGDLKEVYRSRCADFANISFAPAVRKTQVQSLLARCDLLYFSAHESKVWRFGQSLNKVIDYMLAGKPIVGSYTGYPSMISEARSGSFVPAGDAAALEAEILRYVALPRAEREAMGERGRRWLLENRSYRRLAADYIAALRPAQQS